MRRPSLSKAARQATDIGLAVGLGVLLLAVYCGDLLLTPPTAGPVVQEEVAEEKPAANLEPVFKVHIQKEPDETLVMPAKFTIEDEPEELPRKGAAPPVKVEIKDEPAEGETVGGAAIDQNPLVQYHLAPSPWQFGITTTGFAGKAQNKKLTFHFQGGTNTTVVSVNGRSGPLGDPLGRWLAVANPGVPPVVEPSPGAANPSYSTWAMGVGTAGKGGLHFHQVLEVVPGQAASSGGAARRFLDTVLIRWVIHNRDNRNHKAGLRLQLDTLIGNNDGVPFTVPGLPGLVNTFADFTRPQDVPDFIQALEIPNLQFPGTVAHLTAKVGGKIEPPSRLSLTYWPGGNLSWNIPLRPIGGDSAVILYWPEKTLAPDQKRVIGFAYGLGNVTSSNDKLGVTLGGSFEPGQHFTVTAYVENPVANQTLRLELPAGLELFEGSATQAVPQVAAGSRLTSIVTWKVKVARTGDFRLVVHSSTGISQAKTLSIARAAVPQGGKVAVELSGSFEPGQVFQVLGKVSEPLPGQTLSLELPKGLQRVAGEPVQTVPPLQAGMKESAVLWKVQVLQSGRFPVRVASSTGTAQTKTITIARPGRPDANFRIDLEGDFSPGKLFAVKARLSTPAPDQTLTLHLPPGLQRVEGDELQRPANQPDSTLTWKVKILQAGKFPIRVASSTGITLKKTLAIEAPDSSAGRFTFELTGELRPGKEFTVMAQVTDPVPGQKLTLVLPKELKLLDSPPQQAVPSAKGGAAATVSWQVQILESGRLPVRVESSTGLIRTKTITLTRTEGTLIGR